MYLFHIAIATFYQIDVLLSWNYKHMAYIDKERKVVSSNLSQGYTHNLRICTPMAAIYENDHPSLRKRQYPHIFFF